VIQVGARNFGIMVDRVLDTEEIVVKPVAPILRDIEVFSGNTILGDGSVIMILDPNGIASQSGQFGVSNPSAAETAVVKARSSIEERIPLLLCRAGSGAPKVVPLGLVARLEEFDRTTIETSNGRYVVQYRDHLMPLISLDPQAEMSREAGRQPVLVFRDRDRSMGLMVDKIVDIVEGNLKVELRAEAPGRIGTALIAGQATDIVDVGYYLSQAFEDGFKPEEGDLAAQSGRRLLLVDDSAFFLNLMVPQLSAAGFQVTAVESPDRALQLCEKGAAFDIIVSDIEMPGMSGFEFCESVKAGRWRDVPIIALSSCATPRDLERGRSAGFDDYVAKYDRDGLVDTIKSTLTETRGAA
jgi:two-component system chemotaxis sensor kinase CheA